MQIVELPLARAFSDDGTNWQLQVLSERPSHTWRSDNHSDTIQQFFNFGRWHVEKGIYRVPANPLFDLSYMHECCKALIEQIQNNIAKLPFKLKDHFEYWALDAQDQPIALLATDFAKNNLDTLDIQTWKINQSIDPVFHSRHLEAFLTDNNSPAKNHAELLGKIVSKQIDSYGWFRRHKNGGGESINKYHGNLTAEDFPVFDIKLTWQNKHIEQAIRDYIHWNSARLLTLQHLNSTQRSQLEQKALDSALALEQHFRLYPEIVNPKLIEQARVEARLRQVAKTT